MEINLEIILDAFSTNFLAHPARGAGCTQGFGGILKQRLDTKKQGYQNAKCLKASKSPLYASLESRDIKSWN